MTDNQKLTTELRSITDMLRMADNHQQALVLAFEKGIEVGKLESA